VVYFFLSGLGMDQLQVECKKGYRRIRKDAWEQVRSRKERGGIGFRVKVLRRGCLLWLSGRVNFCGDGGEAGFSGCS